MKRRVVLNLFILIFLFSTEIYILATPIPDETLVRENKYYKIYIDKRNSKIVIWEISNKKLINPIIFHIYINSTPIHGKWMLKSEDNDTIIFEISGKKLNITKKFRFYDDKPYIDVFFNIKTFGKKKMVTIINLNIKDLTKIHTYFYYINSSSKIINVEELKNIGVRNTSDQWIGIDNLQEKWFLGIKLLNITDFINIKKIVAQKNFGIILNTTSTVAFKYRIIFINDEETNEIISAGFPIDVAETILNLKRRLKYVMKRISDLTNSLKKKDIELKEAEFKINNMTKELNIMQKRVKDLTNIQLILFIVIVILALFAIVAGIKRTVKLPPPPPPSLTEINIDRLIRDINYYIHDPSISNKDLLIELKNILINIKTKPDISLNGLVKTLRGEYYIISPNEVENEYKSIKASLVLMHRQSDTKFLEKILIKAKEFIDRKDYNSAYILLSLLKTLIQDKSLKLRMQKLRDIGFYEGFSEMV